MARVYVALPASNSDALASREIEAYYQADLDAGNASAIASASLAATITKWAFSCRPDELVEVWLTDVDNSGNESATTILHLISTADGPRIGGSMFVADVEEESSSSSSAGSSLSSSSQCSRSSASTSRHMSSSSESCSSTACSASSLSVSSNSPSSGSSYSESSASPVWSSSSSSSSSSQSGVSSASESSASAI